MKHLIVVAAFLALPYSASARIIISTCGESVDGSAELKADLDCSGFDGTAVTINRGRLKLNGFTLTGNPNENVVGCDTHCKVSRGTISGGRDGISGLTGANSLGTVRATDMTITGVTGVAVSGTVALVKRSTITGNGSVNGSEFALTGGVHASHRVVVRKSTIENNLNFGILTATAVVGGLSSVLGNGTNADCAASPHGISLGCADVAAGSAGRKPTIAGSSVCGTSQVLYSALGTNWGVCTND